jgi:hypothetical protein
MFIKSAVFWVITFPLGLLTREDGTDTFSRNVGKKITTRRRIIPQKTTDFNNSVSLAKGDTP